jgi:hypothetical protein
MANLLNMISPPKRSALSTIADDDDYDDNINAAEASTKEICDM